MRADAGSLRFQILHRRLQDAPTAAAVLRRLPSPRAQRARPRPLRRPRPRPHRPPPPQRRRLPLHTRLTRLQQSVKPVSPFSVDWGAGRLMWRRQRESARSRPCMACRAGGVRHLAGLPGRAPPQQGAPHLRAAAARRAGPRARPRRGRRRAPARGPPRNPDQGPAPARPPAPARRQARPPPAPRRARRWPPATAARGPLPRPRARPCAREGAVTRCAAARGLPRSPPPRAPKARPARSLQHSQHARRWARLGRPHARPPAPAKAAPQARPACPP